MIELRTTSSVEHSRKQKAIQKKLGKYQGRPFGNKTKRIWLILRPKMEQQFTLIVVRANRTISGKFPPTWAWFDVKVTWPGHMTTIIKQKTGEKGAYTGWRGRPFWFSIEWNNLSVLTWDGFGCCGFLFQNFMQHQLQHVREVRQVYTRVGYLQRLLAQTRYRKHTVAGTCSEVNRTTL